MLSLTMTSLLRSTTSRLCLDGILNAISIYLTGCIERASLTTTWPIWTLVTHRPNRMLVTLVSWRWCHILEDWTTTMRVVTSLRLTSVLTLLHALPMVIVGASSHPSRLHGGSLKSLSWRVQSHGWATWSSVHHGVSSVIRTLWAITTHGWTPTTSMRSIHSGVSSHRVTIKVAITSRRSLGKDQPLGVSE